MKALYILFQQNRLYNIILTLVAVLFFSAFYLFLVHATYEVDDAKGGSSFNGMNRYSLTVLKNDASIEQLHSFDENLKESKQATQYVAENVDMYINKFSGGDDFTPENKKEKNDASPVTAIQVNEQAEKLNSIELESGRFFTPKEFNDYSTNQVLPIVLGSSFYNLYDVGDTLNIEVFDTNLKAKIIGFLTEDQTIVTASTTAQGLSHTVLIPTQHYTGIPESTDKFAHASLLNSANSMLVTTASKIGIRDIMTAISAKADFWSVTIVGAGGSVVSLFNTIVKADKMLIFGILIVTLLASIFTLITLQPKRNRRQKSLFKILITTGMREREILKYSYLEWFIMLTVAWLIPIIPFFIISQLAILQLVVYIVGSLIITALFLFVVKSRKTIE